MTDYKPYRYIKGVNPAQDAEFSAAPVYEKIRAGQTTLFWKSGLRWHAIPLKNVQRIFRRVEPVYGKLCCGGQSFFIEWLVLVLSNGEELVLHIGDRVVGDSMQKIAEALLEALKHSHPQIQFGKV